MDANIALLVKLAGMLPNKVGESPVFDQIFEDPATPVVSATSLIDRVDWQLLQ